MTRDARSASDATWTQLTAHFRELAHLEGARAVLAWDQQTQLPPAGAADRGAQLSVLAGICHERVVDRRVRAWLDALEAAELDPV
ncbi:MAG: hypothetical protein H0V89_10665 [Deltaproteobacteria bacterium]|nr:hypothetical protein [Deltaproteobacteria bacterium]